MDASPLWQVVIPKSKFSGKQSTDNVNITARLGGKVKFLVSLFLFTVAIIVHDM